jgi:hypothetical protein
MIELAKNNERIKNDEMETEEMNRRMLLLMFAVMLLTAACSGNVKDKSNTGSETAAPGESTQNNATDAAPTASPTPEPVKYAEEFNKGQILVYPNYLEVELLSTETTTRVDPPNPSSLYTYYEVKEPDKIYYHSVFRVKNLGESVISADKTIDAKITYDGKYNYNGFGTIEEDGGGDFSYTNITGIDPLTDGIIHYINEMPLEAKDSGKEIKLTLQIKDKQLTWNGGTSASETVIIADETPLSSKEEWKEYPELKKDTALVKEDFAELTLTGASFAKKVAPPKASGFYTYYEVKSNNKVYAHVSIAFKNLMTIGKSASEALSVKLIYDNKYEYSGFSFVEDDGGKDFTYSNITTIDPLTSKNLHYLVDVPSEVQDSSGEVAIIVNVNGEKYKHQLK